MIKVHQLNFDNGEYVFINIDLFNRYNTCISALLALCLLNHCLEW